MSSTGSLTSGLAATHELRLVFHGIDRVSNVADSISSKIRAVSGAIVILGATAGLVTELASSFGILDQAQAKTLDRVFALTVGIGGVVNALAMLATSSRVAAAATWLMDEAMMVQEALAGPVGWAILATAAALLAAMGVALAMPAKDDPKPTGGTNPIFGGHYTHAQHGVDMMTSGPMVFMAGEAGRERVIVLPEGSQGSPSGGGLTIHNMTITGATDPAATAKAVKRELELLMAREMGKFS